MDASYSEMLDNECLQFHFDPEDTNLTLQQVLVECERFNQESEHRGVGENGRGSPFGGRLTPMEYFPCNGRITTSGYLSPLFGTPCASGRASPFVGGVGCGATSTSGRATPASPLPSRKQINGDDGRTDKCLPHALATEIRNDEKTEEWNSDEESVNQEEVMRRLDSGQNLYPNCDVTIWLRSCREEVVEPLQGQVIGLIPLWLSGSLIRNGPGSLEVGDMSFDHLFDSSALLHRFAIHKGKVTYQNRFLRSETYKRNQAAQRIVVTEFGTKAVPDPCQSIFQRVSALFHPGESMSDNAMISVYPFGDEFYTFTEAPVIHRIDPKTLETLQRVNVSEHVGIVNHTSHPHVMADATVYNMGMTVSATGPSYTIIEFPPPALTDAEGTKKRVSPFEQARILGSVRARWPLHPAYMHTFGITNNFFVVVEQPLSVSVPHMLKSQLRNDPMAASLRWYQDKQTLIHLLQRSNGKLFKTFHAEAFFYLHIINQYEESDHLVIDICCYKDAAMLDCMYIDSLKGAQHNPDYARMFRGRPLRFVLPLAPPLSQSRGDNLVNLPGTLATATRSPNGQVTVTPELLCDLGCETPRINYELHLGKKYRYFYAISSDVDMENPGTLIKVDIETKTKQTWCEENVFPSEPIFVAAPNPKSEDDGVILAALVWGQGMDNQAGLLVLDARSWTELGRARFTTPSAVPKCLHGWFTASVH